jgi:ubiquinone/menaquinone biosynthesis C-methylase UbiE
MGKPYRAIADYYDAEYEHSPMLQRDVPFFLGQLPRRRQRVLDVTCGTGRASIPIAQAGHRVVGIDYAQDMLDIAIRKRDFVGLSARQLDFGRQDARRIRLGKARFDWATIFFNTFLGFVTLADQDAVLRSIHRHLRPRGRLWLDIFQPNLEILARPESKKFDPSVFWVPSLERTVQRTVDIARDPSKQLQRIVFHYRWFNEEGDEKHETVEFDLTFMFPRELQVLLERNGFLLERIYGDYDGSTLNADSPRMITIARRRS